MNLHLIPGNQLATALRQITVEELLQLGTRQVVYLKERMHDGELAFVLYGADGVPLTAVYDVESAVEMVAENGLSFATIH